MNNYLKKVRQYKATNLAKGIYLFFISLLSAFALLSKATIPSHESALKLTGGFSNPLSIFLGKLRIYLEKAPTLAACVFVLVLLFYLYCEKKQKNKSLNNTRDIYIHLLAMIFSLIMLVGISIKAYGDFTFLHSNYFQMVISIFIFLGYTIFFSKAIRCLFDLIEPSLGTCCCNNSSIKSGRVLFIKAFVCLFICWLPYWLVYLPGSVMYDPFKQFDEYFGLRDWSNWHPVFSTMIYGFIMSTGKTLANDNFGVFLCALYQHIILAASVSYGIYTLNKWQLNKKIRLAILAFFCLHPLIAFQGQSVMKDVSYYAFILCFSIAYLDILRDMSRHENILPQKYILLIIMAILSSLMRHNGVYCTALSMVFLLFNANIKNKLKILGSILAIIFISGLISNSIIKYTDAVPSSSGEMMSIPFQQIARYVKYHDDKLTEEDKQTINEILQYDSLAEKYNPELSDPVKETYKNTKIGTAFFKVWLKCFIKHPSEYVKAFLCNTYSYYYPNGESNVKKIVYNFISDNVRVNTGYFDIHYIGIPGARNILQNILYLSKDLPGIGLLFHHGFYTWLILLFCTYSLYRKMKYWIIASMPLITNLLVCLASPVNGYFRYYMPIIFIIPFVFAWGMQSISAKTTD